MWATLTFLFLVLYGIYASTYINQGSGCQLSSAEVGAVLVGESRTWRITDAVLKRHGLEDILTCTEEQDILSFQTTEPIQLENPMTISKSLTISGATDAVPMFTCPEDNGLMLIQGVNVTISNVSIRDCKLSFLSESTAIIEAAKCDDGVAASLQLDDVVFQDNVHGNGAAGLRVQDPSCYAVTMERVVFASNVFAKSATLGHRNDLRDIQLINNSRSGATEIAMLDFSKSTTVIENLSADGNGLEVIRVKGGTIEVRSSNFTRNAHDATIVAEDSTVMIHSSQFLSNSCEGSCAPVYTTASIVNCRSCRFIKNVVEQGSGGVFAQLSPGLLFDDIQFKRNHVLESGFRSRPYGGALYVLGDPNGRADAAKLEIKNTVVIDNVADFGVGGIAVQYWRGEISVKHTDFVENEGWAEDFGGALSILRPQDLNLSIAECIFRSNSGYRGGGMHIQETAGKGAIATVSVQRSSFSSNEVWKGGQGGAVAVDSFGDIRIEFEDVRFEDNQGDVGGAFWGNNIGVDVRFLDARFMRNRAGSIGGGFAVDLVQAVRVQRSTFHGNVAEGDGGAVNIRRPRTTVEFLTTRMTKNAAKSGGAVYGDGGTAMQWTDCHFDDNRADDRGGAVDAASRTSSFASTTFTGNSASFGGALYTDIGIDSCKIVDSTFRTNRAQLGGAALFRSTRQEVQGDVDIKKTTFGDNFAERGGGALFVDDPSALKIDCNLIAEDPKGGDLGYLSSNVKECRFMMDNAVGVYGYGPDIASSVENYVVSLEFRDGSQIRRERIDPGAAFVIPEWRSGYALPGLNITLVDHFRQGPALPTTRETRNDVVADQLRATVESPDNFVFNKLVSDISDGTGEIVVGSPLRHPGNYTLLIWVGADKHQNVTVHITCRDCIVGELSTLDGRFCLECQATHYNFDPKNGSCEDCPKHADCDQWGIKPKRDYWTPSPCYPRVMECLSEDACRGEARKADLSAFMDQHAPSCHLNTTTTEQFMQIQCHTGYEGPLCGSCSENYGQFELRCFRCLSKGIILLWLLWNTVWTSLTSAISVLGNLHDTGAFQDSEEMIEKAGPSEPITVDRDIPDQDTPLVIPPDDAVPHITIEEKRETAKRNVTESVKLFLNFAQVNSMAVGINNEWTSLVDSIMRILNFIGAASMETPLSLDCLFSKSASVPRSVNRMIISLLLPFVVLAIGALAWRALIINDPAKLRRRWVLTTVVVFYISYIGWVQKMAAAINCLGIPMGITEQQSTRWLFWTEDTAVECFKDSHGIVVAVLVVPMILLVVIAFPIGSAYYLLRKRLDDQLETVSVKEKFGFMYVAYTKDCVYWDCLILLRKASLAVVIVFGASLGSNMQGLVSVCILILALYLNMRFLPYNRDYDTFNAAEIFSLMVSISTFVGGLFMNDPSISQLGRTIVSVIVAALIISFVAYFFYDISMKIVLFCRVALEADGIDVNEGDGGMKIMIVWVKHKSENMRSRMGRSRGQQAPVAGP